MCSGMIDRSDFTIVAVHISRVQCMKKLLEGYVVPLIPAWSTIAAQTGRNGSEKTGVTCEWML